MTLIVQTQQSITVHCPTCGHFKTRHVAGAGCAICAWEILKGWRKSACCKEIFKSHLSDRERDQARAVPKDSHNGQARCATCLEIWWSHDGLICPNGETLFTLLIGEPGRGAERIQ